ncbi:ferredoxin family protein [Novosphingobium naphthalenivorans]|uniref:ferredoxin family protein n=1 Tax=Novosphingobium naphthalenivorans TaxID=273168 RepID=UPI0008295BF9|nr:ferredoxin family protein [Novosphingobium naphthalenivorans]
MSDVMAAPRAKVEEKLFQNRYLVDAGRPHIKVKPHTTPSASLMAMITLCPAGCYSKTENGQVEVAADGCLECGTCRIVTRKTGEVEWNYPRGGFGVLYKFG